MKRDRGFRDNSMEGPLTGPNGAPSRFSARGLLPSLRRAPKKHLDPIETPQSLSLLFEENPLPMWVMDRESRELVAVNRAAIALYGYSREEFLRLKLADLYALGESEAAPALPSELSPPEYGSVLHSHRAKSGEILPVEITSRQLSYLGKLSCLVMVNDVSDRLRMELALKEVDRKYHSMFENAVEGMYQNTPDGRFLQVNPAFAQMLGYDSPEDLCLNLIDIKRQLYVNPMLREAYKVELENKNFLKGLEFEVFRKDRQKLWIRVNVRTVRDESGKLLYYEGTAEDISGRRAAEEELRLLNASLESQAQELARSNSELQQFAYAASHDLQEPLRMVSSYLHLVALRYQGRLDKDADEFIRFAVDGAKRMKLLIDDLLAYSRVGRGDNARVPLDCNAIVTQVRKNLQLSLEETYATIEHGSLPVVMGTQVQLIQLFQNLISNALRFRRDIPPKIRIEASSTESEWIFSVSDNGIGFEMQYAERIFRIFQRLHPVDEYPGTGVGLAICKKIVEGHGGTIWAKSVPNEGSVFHFTLPKP